MTQNSRSKRSEMDCCRDMYLDLLGKALLGLIDKDPPVPLFGRQSFDLALRLNGLDWPSKAFTMIGVKRLANLRAIAESVITSGLDGDFIETGVWRGGAGIMMKGVAKAYGDESRRIWLADSFEGLPPPNTALYPQDKDSEFHEYTDLAVPVEVVRDNFVLFDLMDDNVIFLKGWFKDTLPNAAIQKISLLRLDGDLYESTIQALDSLYDKVVENGYIIVDDYFCVPQCKEAVDDFLAKRGESPSMIKIDDTGIYFRKTRGSSYFSSDFLDATGDCHTGKAGDSPNYEDIATITQKFIINEVKLEDFELRLAERDGQLAEAFARLEAVQEHVATLEAVNKSILSSTSWRLTKPMRFVGESSRTVISYLSGKGGKYQSQAVSGGDNAGISSGMNTRSLNKQVLVMKVKNWLTPHPGLYDCARNGYLFARRVRGLRFPFLNGIRDKGYREYLYISAKDGFLRITGAEGRETYKRLASFDCAYEDAGDFSGKTTDIKAIAYHLPQFHAIPENDEWWGKGFTEWTNTKKAKPLFPGHYQPREPHEDIGYYDLGDVGVLKNQVAMAKRHGIHGFCFYHYWFHGKRLLGKPVDMLLEHREIEMPFCLCWANETWSKRWDGRDHHILIKQEYSPEDDLKFIEFLAPYLKDNRYIKVNGKPMLLVYRISRLSDPMGTTRRWREWCRKNGIGEIHLVSVSHGEVYPYTRLEDVGFDAFAAFPPHSFPCDQAHAEDGVFEGGYRFDYASGVDRFNPSEINGKVYHGCTLGWDNTARFGTKANIYLNFSIGKYYQWLKKAISYTRHNFEPEERLVFINAWNEWAEGSYLEPDKKYGYAYLNTTSRALFNANMDDWNQSERYTQDYDYLKNVIDSGGEHALAAISRFVQPGAEVLEFGCSSGYFTRYLWEEKRAIVDIIELDAECAGRAAAYARAYHVGDIESFQWRQSFNGNKYDYVIFADVLEHLRDPWSVLLEAAKMLKEQGLLIFSVPNIAHAQILSSLFNNDFSYARVGILDQSHLRFFTEPTARQMAIQAGLRVVDLVPVMSPVLPQGCGTLWNKSKVPAKLSKLLSQKEHAHAIQFVVCCGRS